MKELSIEEKAKAYDEAMDRAEKELDACGSQDCDAARQIFRLFPELMGNEDEKIRKELLAVINDLVLPNEQQSRFVTWIEKQDEHKKFRDSIQIGDKVTRNQDGILVNLSQLKRIAKPNETKQGEKKSKTKVDESMIKPDPYPYWTLAPEYKLVNEQKSSLSEEDEKMLSDIIKDLVHPWNEYIPDRIEDEIIWLKNKLKSLKPQSQWKPSDAQMASITCAVRKMKESACYDSEIVSLYQDLKKLREE